MSYQVDSYGNAYFPAGVSVASIPATTGTQNKVLVPGPGGRISSASISQLITQSGGNLVSSIFGRTGVITALRGDYNTDQVTEGQALYFTDSRARKALSVTTFNTSGPATYDSTTGIINIPQYGSGIVGNYVPVTRTITINGQTADLSANRIFSIDPMVYPSAGIPLSNGTSWGTSIVNNSANWNTAFGWGDHAGLYSLLGHTHTFASLTSIPTTLAGYGITDAATSAQGTNADTAYSWGNHALAGYLTSFTETDPIYTASTWYTTTNNATNWNTAYTWGNHALAGYLTSFTETDPVWTSEKANYALKTYVDTSISNLVDSAPTTLDTLNELAAALGDDANFSTTITNLIGTKEPAITAGTTAQYWRGDKTWQTLPVYTLSGLGGVPTTRTLTINGTSYDLSADRSWSITSMIYPSAGIAVSTGSAWGTSITDNSSNWNTAYSWGNHASAGYLTASSAASTYLTISNASSTYLSQSSANTIYLNKTDAASTYLSQSSANTIYLNKTDAASTYLSQSSAASIYLSISNASSTYLSQSSAALTYVSLSGSYSNPSWVTSLAWSKITGAPAFITSYTETDTLASVVSRGSSVSSAIYIDQVTSGGYVFRTSNSWGGWARNAFTIADGSSNLLVTLGGYGGSGTSLSYAYIGLAYNNNWITFSSSAVNSQVALQQGGNQVWHAGNLTNLNQLSNGPGYITGYTETDTFGTVVSRGTVATTSTSYGLSLTHTYNQSSLFHNALFLKANNSGAEVGASIGFAVVTAGGDHHRAVIRATGTSGNTGGQFAIYTRRGSDAENIRGYYQDDVGNVRLDNYVGIGQDPNTGYRLIVSGSMYLNANGNGWAEGVWKQRRSGGTFYDVIDAGNIGSQSVSYASSAGNADTVDGYHATNAASGLAKYESNGYLYIPSWMNVNGGGIFSSTNNAHLRPNTSSYGSWEIIGSKGGWSGVYFNDSTTTLMINSNEGGHYNNNYGWQYRWYQGTIYVSRSTYGGGTEYTVWDSGNLTNLNQLTNGPGYITGYSETDTLGSVTGRGASTSTYSAFNGGLNVGSSKVGFRAAGATEFIQGESWTMGIYGYNSNDGFLFYQRDTSDVAHPCFHIGGWNNAAYGGYSNADSMITLVRGDGTKTDGSTYATRGLSSSSYYSNIIKTTGGTIFRDSQSSHTFTGAVFTNGVSIHTPGDGGAGSQATVVAIRVRGLSGYDSLEFGTENNYDGVIRSYGNDIRYYAGHWRSVGNTSSENHSHYWYTSKAGSTNWSNHKMRLDHDGVLTVASHVSTPGNLHTNRGRVAFSSTAGDANHTIYNNYLNIDGEGSFDGMKMNVYAGLHVRTGSFSSPSLVLDLNATRTIIGAGELWCGQASSRNGGVALILNDGSLLMRASGDNYHKMWYYDGIAFATNSAHGHFRFYAETNTQRNNSTGGATLVFDINSVNGNAWASGDITAYSDSRVKKDIKVIENSIEKIQAIRGVTFLRTDAQEQDKEKRHAGVIAQEVLEVLPEVVTENTEGMYSVAYGNLVALLIEGMKEQQTQIEELKNEIKELKNK